MTPTIAQLAGAAHTVRMNIDEGLVIARAVAATGEHRNWRGVETKLQQLGHHEAELWFASLATRGEIDGLCVKYFKGSS